MSEPVYRLTPKGCLYTAILDTFKASNIGFKGDMNDLSKYAENLYNTFEEIMLSNEYRIINLEDFANAGVFK